MNVRRAAIGALPHAIVERERNRRLLRRLDAADQRPAAASAAIECRLDLLPSGALGTIETVVDIGANEGRWSLGVLRLARPRRLIAVEPSPQILPSLRLALGGYRQAEIVEAAIGAVSGKVTFNITSHSHNASVLSPRTAEMNRAYGHGYDLMDQVTVPMLTLDELTARIAHLTLLKIDVQGFESAVVAGGSTALGKTKWILIEANFRSHYDNDILFPALHSILTHEGFRLLGMSPPFVRRGIAMWADALYENERVSQ